MSETDNIRKRLGRRITDLMDDEDILNDKVLLAMAQVTKDSFYDIDCSDIMASSDFTNEELASLKEVRKRYNDLYPKPIGPSHGQKKPPTLKEIPRNPTLDPHETKDLTLYYELKGKEMIGHALIIINEYFPDAGFEKPKRGGADQDRIHLNEMFASLRINCTNHTNLNSEQMVKEITEFAEKTSKCDTSVIFIAISSHGNADNIIGVKHSDEKSDLISVSKIQKLIKFKGLDGIPKILILQACRGSRYQRKMEIMDKSDGNASPSENTDLVSSSAGEEIKFAVISYDTLILFPTSLYFVSFRSTKDGSWMISELKKCIDAHKETHHFINILTICSREILQKYDGTDDAKQTCTYKSTLTKFLSFRH